MEWKQIQFIIIYYLFYAWFRVRTYSEESECEMDLLDMFKWVQSCVQAQVVNGTIVRFSIYEMMLKNCSSTLYLSFKNVAVVGKNQFCIGFAMEIVKCRKMMTCLLIPNCFIWRGVPCLSYLKILTQCSILLSWVPFAWHSLLYN